MRHVRVVGHAAADEADGAAAAARATSAARWMRGMEVAKQETRTRPRVRAKISSKAGIRSSSPPVRPRTSTLVLSERRASTPRSPQRGEGLHVGALVGGASRADLEVAAREHHARRGLDGEGQAVERRCARRGSGCTRKGPSVDGLPGDEHAEVGLDAALPQPAPREAEGEAAAVDRRRRRLQREGQRADVVLVAVGEEDAVQPARPWRGSGSRARWSPRPGSSALRKSTPRVDEQRDAPPTPAPAR